MLQLLMIGSIDFWGYTHLLAVSRANVPVKAIMHDFNKPLMQELAERFLQSRGSRH
jgi:hypothetical protein